MVWENRGGEKIILLAIHSSFFETTKPIAEKLVRKGFEVIHPPTVENFIALSDKIYAGSTVVTLYFTEDKKFRGGLSSLEQKRIIMIDSYSQMQLTEDRVMTFNLLRLHGIKTPQYFWGNTKETPYTLGDQLVQKDPYGHDVTLINRKNLFYLGKKTIYVEERIPNTEGIVRCVMYIFGYIYTRIKHDKFSDNEVIPSGAEPIVHSTRPEIDLAQRIHKVTNMNLFNIDLIQDRVLEINCCPNFFLYEPAIEHFVRGLTKVISNERSTRV